ncbi:Glycosyltransferase family 4 protein [Sulfidibacter corallicola]|uniref:Glycosyltransferase family 4 protein n=1 Tax=Sulfidibacter corallicola TaxID=2818388 RepID=A0A8A4TNA4_SULCO|nr:glycosyltransferase family 4 protein [Sulfidibacter corallicola]QTD51030.1 glycosyltransferase family 4 protein [Sulfidibacter corallicola]
MAQDQMAYLCSQYPAISHTFINREIEQIEAQGIKVHPFTMNPGQVLAGGTEFEKAQLEITYCLKKQNIFSVLQAQVSQFLRAPIGYLGGLFYAIKLQQGRPRDTLWAIFHFIEAAMLARQMRKRGLKHVHVHFGGSEASIALYACRAFGTTYSFTLHGPDVFYRIAAINLPEKIRNAKFVVCISNFARGQAIRLVGVRDLDKFPIVHCGVDPDRYTPEGKEPDKDVFQIVCTGRLTPTKGQALLVMACKQLKDEGRQFQCKLIGGGDEAADLQRMVNELDLGDRVILTGPLPQDGVLDALKRAHLFVLPSFAEGVPVVLMEAMSMEIPSVSTRVGGIAELIDSGQNSYLIHSGDPDGLADILRQAMDRPEELARIGKAARAFIKEEFDIRTNGTKLAKIFRDRATF